MLIAALITSTSFFMGSHDEGTKNAIAQLEGVWSFLSVEVNGTKQPAVPFATNKIIIAKDGRYVVVQGPRLTYGTLKVVPTKSPKHYDVTLSGGSLKGQTLPGIYELEGDKLKLCFSLRGKDRPTNFDSTANAGHLLHVLKRESKDVREAWLVVGHQDLASTWQAVSYALNGNKASDEEMKKVQLTIDVSGKSAALLEGKVFIASTIKINPTSSPMAMDISFTEGESKGKTALGIYKIEDNVLTICRAAPDQPRPTEFSSNPESGHTLMSYKREPKK